VPKFKDLKINSQFIRKGCVAENRVMLYLKYDENHLLSSIFRVPERIDPETEVILIITGSGLDDLYGHAPMSEACTTEQVHGEPNLHNRVYIVEFLNGDVTYDIRVFSTKAKADKYAEAKALYGHKGKIITSEMFLDPEPPKPEEPQYKRDCAVNYDPITGNSSILILKDRKRYLSVYGKSVSDMVTEANKIVEWLNKGGNNEIQSASA
jgi:hypothetical protein